VYVLGDAFSAADLASQVGRRTGAKVISVDYRLAPEHPYPAAVDDALAAYEALLDDGIAPSDIVFAGESAGGGLAVATLVNARDHGLPLPAAAFVMSPYADLTLAGTTIDTKREADPLLSRELLEPRVTDYTAGQDAALGLISPVFADLSGLPPLIIQAGSHEVLLDDAVRLARQAATADVEVTLDITPGVPHVFQAYTRSSTKRPPRWTEPDSSCRPWPPPRCWRPTGRPMTRPIGRWMNGNLCRCGTYPRIRHAIGRGRRDPGRGPRPAAAGRPPELEMRR
jgi:acetyl esterase/lipase